MDPELEAIYKDTDYYVSDDPPLLLKIGERNDDALILLGSFGVTTAAFLTAWNPGSQKLTEDENDERQSHLLSEIEQLRLNYFVGWGERDEWREYSYLVLGITREEATELGKQFEQNAYVFLDETGIPELVNLQ